MGFVGELPKLWHFTLIFKILNMIKEMCIDQYLSMLFKINIYQCHSDSIIIHFLIILLMILYMSF